MLNLDTHILVFLLVGARERLTARERRLVESQPWGISGIVLWELAMLADRRRISLDFDDREVQRVLAQITVWPIDLAIARTSMRLDFRADPADHLIAATGIVHDVPLLTHDDRIRSSKMVPFA